MSATHFMVRKNALDKRWDAFYYEPEIVALERRVQQKATHTLRDFVRFMSGGATPLKSESDQHYTDAANGVPFIRVQNLTSTGVLDLQDVKHITHNTNNSSLARSRLSGGELLVKITGVGRMAVASVVPDGLEANINQHIAAIKTDSKAQSEVLAAYLNLDFVERLATRRATGGTRPALDYNALLSIPIIDDPRIVNIMQIAYAEKKRLETEASELLASLDAVLFQALNIKIPPKPESTVGSRIFTVKQGALSGWRFDPAYFEVRLSVLRQAIQDGKNKLMPLGKVCAFLSNGRTPAADEYSDSQTTFPVIKVASYQNELIDLKKVEYATSPQTFAVQKGDVFVLSAAHQPDYVGRFVKQLDDEPQTPTSFVGELICLRANRSMLEPDYLFALFSSNTFQNLLNCEKRGQTSHIYPSDIKHILIPVPSPDEQVQIAERVRSIRNEARHLRNQSDLILQQAKQSVEKLILGEP